MTIVVPVHETPRLTLGPAYSGRIVTTHWAEQPKIPADLPVGFQCTIINDSQASWASNRLNCPLFVLGGRNFENCVDAFSLRPGQSCVLSVVRVGASLRYFVGLGRAR